MLPKNKVEIIKVIVKLMIPCINLSDIYLKRGTLCLLVNELTWAIIESPENEQRKLIILSFKESVSSLAAKILHPFVISTLPRNNAYKQFLGKCKNVSMFWNNKAIWGLLFIIPIITENKIIKPPTERVVFIAFWIEFLNASPKLLGFDCSNFLSDE